MSLGAQQQPALEPASALAAAPVALPTSNPFLPRLPGQVTGSPTLIQRNAPLAVDRSLPFPLARSASLSPPTLTALALASRLRSLFSLAPCRPSSPSPQAFSPLPSPHLPSLSHHHAQLAEMANATLTTLLSPLSPALAFAPCINGADCSWTSGWKQGWANDGAWSGLSERYAEGWAVGSALAVSADLQGASRRPSFDWLPMQRMCAGGLPRPWPASLHTARGPSAPLFSLATTDALPSSLPSVPRALLPQARASASSSSRRRSTT